MAKQIDMTRARKIALPVVLRIARVATRHVPLTDTQRRELEEALEAFNDC